MQHVIREDYLNDNVKLEIERFNRSVEDWLSGQNVTLHDQNGFYIQDEPDDNAPTTICEEDHGDISLPETPDVDDVDDDLTDKFLNAGLIFDVGTFHERNGRVVKRAKGTSGEPSGVRTPTRSSTPVSTWSSSRMDHPRTTSCMSLPSACMRKWIPRGTNIKFSAKSRTTGPIIRVSKLLMVLRPVAIVIVSRSQRLAAGPFWSHGKTDHPIGCL